MSNTRQLLKEHTLEDVFTVVYVMVDDYMKASLATGRFSLPQAANQKGSYAELMSIALVGEMLGQPHSGTWFMLVADLGKDLFPVLPDVTRYHRILKNLERIWADFALCLANMVYPDTTYSIDSKPIPICKRKRKAFYRAMSEASSGFSTQGSVFGFKLHAVVNNLQMVCRFAIVSANEADPTVGKALLNPAQDELDRVLGDKAYLGCGVFTPPKTNALNPGVWTKLMDRARKLIECAFSSLTRSKHLVLGQLNSFWSVRASVCRKIAAHNLGISLGLGL
jgi:hypothetical protein